jgi:hypothetical protein
MKSHTPAPTATFVPTLVEPRISYERKNAAKALSISVRSLDYLIGQVRHPPPRKKGHDPHPELVRFARADHPESFAKRPGRTLLRSSCGTGG